MAQSSQRHTLSCQEISPMKRITLAASLLAIAACSGGEKAPAAATTPASTAAVAAPAMDSAAMKAAADSAAKGAPAAAAASPAADAKTEPKKLP